MRRHIKKNLKTKKRLKKTTSVINPVLLHVNLKICQNIFMFTITISKLLNEPFDKMSLVYSF
jgi:hypothetical protein